MRHHIHSTLKRGGIFCLARGGGALILSALLFFFSFDLPCFELLGQEPDLSEGPILGNPMEKLFDAPSSLPQREGSSGSFRVFSESSFPSGVRSAPASVPLDASSPGSSIVQMSGEGASSGGGVWDWALAAANNSASDSGAGVRSDQSHSHWGVGPWGTMPGAVQPGGQPSVPSSGSTNSSSGSTAWGGGANGYPPGYLNNFGFGSVHSFPQMPVAPSQVPNPYSNTGDMSYASPPGLPQANLLPGVYGLGYYNPSTGQIQTPAWPGLGGGSSGYPYPNMYGNPFGGMNSSMYGGGMYGHGMSPEVLAQAMLQQEQIRHEVAMEIEAEEEARRREEAAQKEREEKWSMKQLVPLRVSSPLGTTLVSCAKTLSPFTSPTGPDRGVGMPLATRSWQDRPYYLGFFIGNTWGSELVSDMIEQKSGANGGLRLGYYLNDYWGIEGRLHYTSIRIRDTANAEAILRDIYSAAYPDETIVSLATSRSNQLTTLDLSILYYPLGNAKFRPFFSYGLGITHEKFADSFGQDCTYDILAMPIGVGMRYWWNDRLSLQMDLVDNIVFSEGIAKTQHNWALSFGVTYAFGTSKQRRPVPYWPYTPSSGSKW